MRVREMIPLACWLAALVVGTASAGPTAAPAESTTKPVPVRAEDDTVNQGLRRVVVVTLTIDGQNLRQTAARIVSLPRALAPSPHGPGGPVQVEALRKDVSAGAHGKSAAADYKRVLKLSVPYEKVNAAEHGGLVTVRPSSLTLVLPVEEPFERLSVKLPDQPQPHFFELGPLFTGFCRTNKSDEWCRPPLALQ
ncbi:MAG TPA: hypothetical protein VHR45_25490 [Thermoanaerobaculia bacterium]|nr:hypothetical protein [Thermoanaerobaculia bacterium]